jgi:hypothetical protein
LVVAEVFLEAMVQLAVMERLIQVGAQPLDGVVMEAQAALASSSFATQPHTLMQQLQAHQHPQKQQQTGIRFIPSLPLEQSPSKEQT